MTTDQAAYNKIAAYFAANRGARVYFSRQFYNTTKNVKITNGTFAGCVRINEKTGKLQLWEGKKAGGWIDVLGLYRVTAD